MKAAIDSRPFFRVTVYLMTLWLAGCAAFLGLEDGRDAPDSCRSSDECAPDQICAADRCRSNACSQPNAAGCRVLQPQICSTHNVWQSKGLECENMCRDGGCRISNSCALNSPRCGAMDRQCCKANGVPGGSYGLYTSTGVFVTRSVSPFAMDEFEVTVGRFKRFMENYDQLDVYGSELWPSDGMGANRHVPGSGWRAEFHERRLLPKTQLDVRTWILSNCPADVLDDEQAPMRCVDWYLAWAFCIWDGGRLPTEAEWTYAANGGDSQRLYPWSESAFELSLTRARAAYSEDETNRLSQPSRVGMHHEGHGVFGHEDLAGNVAEWAADDYEPDPPEFCRQDRVAGADASRDCLANSKGQFRVVRGGDYASTAEQLKNTSRGWLNPEFGLPQVGFRCARD